MKWLALFVEILFLVPGPLPCSSIVQRILGKLNRHPHTTHTPPFPLGVCQLLVLQLQPLVDARNPCTNQPKWINFRGRLSFWGFICAQSVTARRCGHVLTGKLGPF